MEVQLADESHWDDLVIIIAVVCQCDLCCITDIAHRVMVPLTPILNYIVTPFYHFYPNIFLLLCCFVELGQFKAEGNQ